MFTRVGRLLDLKLTEIQTQHFIIFTDWDPTAASDMQALLDVFDTNHDGSLDAGDANKAKRLPRGLARAVPLPAGRKRASHIRIHAA